MHRVDPHDDAGVGGEVEVGVVDVHVAGVHAIGGAKRSASE